MNKILIPPGGMPFEGDDLLFMQNAYRDAISALGSVFAPTGSVVLSGCLLTTSGANILVSAGFIYRAGEVLYFPGGTATNGVGEPFRWSLGLSVTYDPAGLEVFADSVSRNTYEVRRAILKFDNTTPPAEDIPLDIIDSRRISFSFASKACVMHSLTTGSIVAHRFNNRVQITGRITAGLISSLEAIFTVPEGFRPSTNHSVILSLDVSPLNYFGATAPLESDKVISFVQALIHCRLEPSGQAFLIHPRTNNLGDVGLGGLTVSLSYYV